MSSVISSIAIEAIRELLIILQTRNTINQSLKNDFYKEQGKLSELLPIIFEIRHDGPISDSDLLDIKTITSLSMKEGEDVDDFKDRICDECTKIRIRMDLLKEIWMKNLDECQVIARNILSEIGAEIIYYEDSTIISSIKFGTTEYSDNRIYDTNKSDIIENTLFLAGRVLSSY